MVIALKVRIEMTPEQAKQYADDYGVDPANLRADIASHVQNAPQCSAAFDVEADCTKPITVS